MKTVEEHKKDGTYRKDRHGGIELTMEPLDALPPPVDLTKEAAKAWAEIVPALLSAKLITIADKAALIDAFNNYGIAQDCLAEVNGYESYGAYLRNLNKFKDVNLIDEYNARMDKFNKIMEKFGVGSPLARTRIKIKPSENADDDFLKNLIGNG